MSSCRSSRRYIRRTGRACLPSPAAVLHTPQPGAAAHGIRATAQHPGRIGRPDLAQQEKPGRGVPPDTPHPRPGRPHLTQQSTASKLWSSSDQPCGSTLRLRTKKRSRRGLRASSAAFRPWPTTWAMVVGGCRCRWAPQQAGGSGQRSGLGWVGGWEAGTGGGGRRRMKSAMQQAGKAALCHHHVCHACCSSPHGVHLLRQGAGVLMVLRLSTIAGPVWVVRKQAAPPALPAPRACARVYMCAACMRTCACCGSCAPCCTALLAAGATPSCCTGPAQRRRAECAAGTAPSPAAAAAAAGRQGNTKGACVRGGGGGRGRGRGWAGAKRRGGGADDELRRERAEAPGPCCSSGLGHHHQAGAKNA